MDLHKSITWMFIGSIIIGIFFNGMNVLAYKLEHLYLSPTLVYGALLMASNMAILEILMHYSASKIMSVKLLITFTLFTIFLMVSLREQYLVADNGYLKRMISHHSTAITTSHKILGKTKNEKVRKLASKIIETQEREINLMKSLLV